MSAHMSYIGNIELGKMIGLESGKIDVHSHILPGFDDGTRDIEEAFEICSAMKNNGYEAIVWTPHYNLPVFPHVNADSIKEHYDRYAPMIEEKTGLKIFMGSELFCTLPLPERLIPLADTDFMLVEFPYDTYPRYLDDVLYDIQLKGYRIIFAHVERYKWLFPERKKLFKKTYDYSLVEQLKEKGIYFQVNQTTLENPERFKHMASLYANKYVEFIASDKHRRDDNRYLINFCQ